MSRGKCLVCLAVAYFDCITCGYSFCSADSHLYSHIIDYDHKQWSHSGSSIGVNCLMCHSTDILTLYYAKEGVAL